MRGVRLRAALWPPAPLLPGPVVALLRQAHLPHHPALPPAHCPGMNDHRLQIITLFSLINWVNYTCSIEVFWVISRYIY